MTDFNFLSGLGMSIWSIVQVESVRVPITGIKYVKAVLK